ncbi:YybH family protein [Flavitalea flava]
MRMPFFSPFLLFILSFSGITRTYAQANPGNLPQNQLTTNDDAAIRKIMAEQTLAWNQGNLDEFMAGYWHNDSLLFIGQSGLSYGYRNALNNYKKNYPDQEKMGKLFFTLLRIDKLSPDYCFVIGKWFLKRTVGDIGGHYSLLLRKIDGRWQIIADHSS